MVTNIPPADKLADFDVSTLDYRAAVEYRHELYTALLNPGIEYDEYDNDGREFYKTRLALVDTHIATFGLDDPAGGNLP